MWEATGGVARWLAGWHSAALRPVRASLASHVGCAPLGSVAQCARPRLGCLSPPGYTHREPRPRRRCSRSPVPKALDASSRGARRGRLYRNESERLRSGFAAGRHPIGHRAADRGFWRLRNHRVKEQAGAGQIGHHHRRPDRPRRRHSAQGLYFQMQAGHERHCSLSPPSAGRPKQAERRAGR